MIKVFLLQQITACKCRQSGFIACPPKTRVTASDGFGHLLVCMSGSQYGMGVDYARRLMESLRLAINAAGLVCDDCNVKDSSVERSGCPDAIKHGHGKPATLCDACFNPSFLIGVQTKSPFPGPHIAPPFSLEAPLIPGAVVYVMLAGEQINYSRKPEDHSNNKHG